jgi:hypothetical protein
MRWPHGIGNAIYDKNMLGELLQHFRIRKTLSKSFPKNRQPINETLLPPKKNILTTDFESSIGRLQFTNFQLLHPKTHDNMVSRVTIQLCTTIRWPKRVPNPALIHVGIGRSHLDVDAGCGLHLDVDNEMK